VDDLDDRAALAAYRQGDSGPFVALVERYHRPVYNAAYNILRRADDATDVTQTVFLRVIERLDDYDPQYRFFSWLYRIAVNEALDTLRRNGREDPLDDDVELPDLEGRDPEALLDRAQQSARLRACLLRLPTGDRAVLTLRHYAELTYEEIADVLEVDEATVKSRLFEARRHLRRLFIRVEVH
jgi:RNA polymerase sigma-70 factor (ECF subfamily)